MMMPKNACTCFKTQLYCNKILSKHDRTHKFRILKVYLKTAHYTKLVLSENNVEKKKMGEYAYQKQSCMLLLSGKPYHKISINIMSSWPASRLWL